MTASTMTNTSYGANSTIYATTTTQSTTHNQYDVTTMTDPTRSNTMTKHPTTNTKSTKSTTMIPQHHASPTTKHTTKHATEYPAKYEYTRMSLSTTLNSWHRPTSPFTSCQRKHTTTKKRKENHYEMIFDRVWYFLNSHCRFGIACLLLPPLQSRPNR